MYDFLLGNFHGASVSLAENNLTRFDEGVFKEMLSQMNIINRGEINVYNSE